MGGKVKCGAAAHGVDEATCQSRPSSKEETSRDGCAIGAIADELLANLDLRTKVNAGLEFPGRNNGAMAGDDYVRALESVRYESPFGVSAKFSSGFRELGSQTLHRVGIVYDEDVIAFLAKLS